MKHPSPVSNVVAFALGSLKTSIVCVLRRSAEGVGAGKNRLKGDGNGMGWRFGSGEVGGVKRHPSSVAVELSCMSHSKVVGGVVKNGREGDVIGEMS